MDKKNVCHTRCFSAADILLPGSGDLQRWAVIACDQFTSQPDYWKKVEEITDGFPSAYHVILPESELKRECLPKVKEIHQMMQTYLEKQVFSEYPDCFVYSERYFPNGKVRRGLIGKVDLEEYAYSEGSNPKIRATEKTVSERIPPRMQIRRNALLELPHVILLCNDEQCRLIEPLSEMKWQLPKLYDFDLMLNGGHITGWLISGDRKTEIEKRLAEYEEQERQKHPNSCMIYAVGDGNHSLATAKACFEEMKACSPDTDFSGHPARYALCELNNIHDPDQCIQPIHRIVKECDTQLLLQDLMRTFDSKVGAEVLWGTERESGTVMLPSEEGELPLVYLQCFLDRWLENHKGELDFIHGEEALKELEKASDCIGFQLPPIDKKILFSEIMAHGVLPRKTFSLGEAEEKRYYLEARKIR